MPGFLRIGFVETLYVDMLFAQRHSLRSDARSRLRGDAYLLFQPQPLFDDQHFFQYRHDKRVAFVPLHRRIALDPRIDGNMLDLEPLLDQRLIDADHGLGHGLVNAYATSGLDKSLADLQHFLRDRYVQTSLRVLFVRHSFLKTADEFGSASFAHRHARLNLLLMTLLSAHVDRRTDRGRMGTVMATIIAGRFDEQATADAAVVALRDAGFPAGHISSFYVSPAGQHAQYPIGGDHDKSAGAEETPKGTTAGTATGGLVGAAIGAVTTPLTGPIGAITGGLVGAHVGNLVGALGKMKDDDSAGAAPPIRHAGLLVAVSTPNADCEERAIRILGERGALAIESGVGHIIQGNWEDFDPAMPPNLIDMKQSPGLSAG